MTRLKWAPQSQEDMEEIYEAIWHENSAAAERIFDKLEDAALSLISYPRLGLRREEVPVRFAPLGCSALSHLLRDATR